MAESVFAITLLQWAGFFNSKASKETKGILTKNRCEVIAFFPDTLFKIAQCYNSRFCAEREEIFILFIVKTHIVGIAVGASFLQRARYLPRGIFR